MALRQMNAYVGLQPVNWVLCSLGSMVKEHGAEEGMVIQLFCFHRLLVLHLAACSVIR